MDSLYGHFYTLRPILSQTLTDYSEVKMLSRTEIIYNEAKRLIGNISDKKVVNVGVVGDIIKKLV